jgi:uncharacterized protein (DUF983 family)
MPPAQIHCRECRQLLNPELSHNSVEVPEFVPLQELDSMAEITPLGLYCTCPSCGKELKVARKYIGQTVQCKHCQSGFRLDPVSPVVRQADLYSKCNHCQQQLRFDPKYIGARVACRFCGGKLTIVPEAHH